MKFRVTLLAIILAVQCAVVVFVNFRSRTGQKALARQYDAIEQTQKRTEQNQAELDRRLADCEKAAAVAVDSCKAGEVLQYGSPAQFPRWDAGGQGEHCDLSLNTKTGAKFCFDRTDGTGKRIPFSPKDADELDGLMKKYVCATPEPPEPQQCAVIHRPAAGCPAGYSAEVEPRFTEPDGSKQFACVSRDPHKQDCTDVLHPGEGEELHFEIHLPETTEPRT